MNGVAGGDLIIHAVENILFVALVVNDGKLRRIEEAAAVQSIGRNEVSPVLASVAEVDGEICQCQNCRRRW